MSGGRFSGTVHGTWETGGGLPVLPAVAVLLAAAVSWLATVLWLLALAIGVFLTVALGGLVVLRRWNRRETDRFVARVGALGEVPRHAIAAPAALTVNHFHGGTHLHLGDAPGDSRVIRAAPDPGGITGQHA